MQSFYLMPKVVAALEIFKIGNDTRLFNTYCQSQPGILVVDNATLPLYNRINVTL